MPGRRKSNAELMKTGSALHKDEQSIPLGQPDCPADLTDAEAAIWERTVSLLFEAKRCTRLDGAALRAFCRVCVEWDAAFADLQKFGYYQTAGTGAQKLSVQFQRFNTVDRALQRWCSELGLSPKSRPASVVTEPDGPSLSEWLDSEVSDGDK